MLRKILPPFKSSTLVKNENVSNNEFDNYHELIKKRNILPLLKVLIVSVFILFLGIVLFYILPDKNSMTVVILIVTTLGVIASNISFVNKTKYSFDLGMYFILVFSFAIASMADIHSIINNFSYFSFFVLISIFGSLIIHVFLSKIFKIDADTTIITSTALICSPPFVPIVAGQLKNK